MHTRKELSSSTCTLLDDQDRDELELEQGNPQSVSGGVSCSWTDPAEGVTISISYFEDLAYDNRDVGGPPNRTTIGKHKAAAYSPKYGVSKEIALAVGPRATVVISAISTRSSAQAEPLNRATTIVEPKLPVPGS